MKTSKAANKILVELVKIYETNPSVLSEPGFGMDIWELAARAAMITKQEADQRRQHYLHGAWDNLPIVRKLMIDRGWVTSSELGAYGKHSVALYPTLQGIDYAHRLMRSRPVKIWHIVKVHAKKIIIPLAIAIIGSIIAYLIIR